MANFLGCLFLDLKKKICFHIKLHTIFVSVFAKKLVFSLGWWVDIWVVGWVVITRFKVNSARLALELGNNLGHLSFIVKALEIIISSSKKLSVVQLTFESVYLYMLSICQ